MSENKRQDNFVEENFTSFINEISLVISMFKSGDVFLDIEKYTNNKYDFFFEVTRELYKYYELCFKTYSMNINADSFTQFMIGDKKREEFYESIGGWEYIQELINVTDENSYKNYFDNVKKMALLRELYNKGFPSHKIKGLQKFEQMKAEDVFNIMNVNLNKIYTDIGSGRDAIKLGADAVAKVMALKEVPDIGSPLADFKLMTSMTRGLRKKKLMLLGALSNEGKSRMMMYIAVHNAMLNETPTLVIMNETSEEDAFLCQLTTILNAPNFSYQHNIVEEQIATGNYREGQFDQVIDVAKWIEENTNIYFIETTRYTDKDLERLIKQYAIGKGVELFIYDTMKSTDDGDWTTLKKTANFLKNTATELNISGIATFQLTDDTSLLAPHELTSNNISSSKHIKHVADTVFMMRKIESNHYDKYAIISDDEFGKGEILLDKNRTYYFFKCDKNRAGKKINLIFEVDLDTNLWTEKGIAKVIYKNK